jgi:uncharacterized protein (DUF1697 family)
MARQIALLRGINVGGTKKVPMAQLRELMAELGYTDVTTYVQSGNVVFTGPDAAPATVERALEQAIATAFGFDVAVVVRTRDELADVVAANPLADLAEDPAKYLVLFLSGRLDPARLADLDPADFAPEAFVLGEREIYLWNPEGVGVSAIVKALTPKRLGLTATGRNWRTVEKLLALADAADA